MCNRPMGTGPLPHPTRMPPPCGSSYSDTPRLATWPRQNQLDRLLRNHIDEPVRSRERTLILRRHEAGGRKVLYYVEVKVA